MQTNEYLALKTKIPDFDTLYCQRIDTNSIVFDEHTSQVRKLGHVVNNVEPYGRAMERGDQFPPATVVALPNGKYELIDGATRVLAAMKVEKLVFISTYHDQCGAFRNSYDRYDFQCSSNNHIAATPNTKEDIKHQIQSRVDDGNFDARLGYKYVTDPDAYINDCAEHCKDLYTHSKFGLRTFKSMVKQCLKGEISLAFENYTKDTAVQAVARMNDFGWVPSRLDRRAIGKIYEDKAVYVPGTVIQFKQNDLSNAIAKRRENSNVGIHVILYVSRLAGKTDTAINERRRAAKNHFDFYQRELKLCGKPLFASFNCLPQIKNGPNKEDMSKFVDPAKYTGKYT